MKNYSAVIIDDEVNAINLLEVSLKLLFPEIIVASKCVHWKDALKMLKENSYDILFLDISMPEKSGMDLLRLIPQVAGEIIFITAHQEFAVEAFKYQAVGYILKPFDDSELSDTVNRAIAKIEQKSAIVHKSAPNIIGIPNIKGVDYIDVNDIIYLQAHNKCTRIILKGKELYSSQYLGRFREILSEDDFFQVHRSYIVNIKAIKSYISNTTTLIMADDSEIPVARALRGNFFNLFMIFK